MSTGITQLSRGTTKIKAILAGTTANVERNASSIFTDVSTCKAPATEIT